MIDNTIYDITRHTSHVTRHTSYVIRHTSQIKQSNHYEKNHHNSSNINRSMHLLS
jgi:hypothetical protein